MPSQPTNNYTTETRAQIKAADLIMLVCDYDGTLVPLPQKDEKPAMAETVKDHLEHLVQIPSVRFGVMSSRGQLDLKDLLPLKKTHYLTNHGFEVTGPEVNFSHSIATKCRRSIHDAVNTLRVQLRIDRVIIKDHGLCATLNYRDVLESQVSSLLAKCRNLLANSVQERQVRVEEGRRTLEILPAVDWDRGKALKLLYQNYKAMYPEQKLLLLYVGDGHMDEEAFKFTRQVGISYRVTRHKETTAMYYLKMQTEISRVLKLVRESAPDREPQAAKETIVL